MNENNRLVKKAQERVKSAKIVFTTCAGAGLGILRKINFEIVIIDEASQITEACALIPLVKGCKKAVLVGDQYVVVFVGYQPQLLDTQPFQCPTPPDGSKYGKSASSRRFNARTVVHRSKLQGNVQDDVKRKFPSPRNVRSPGGSTEHIFSHTGPVSFPRTTRSLPLERILSEPAEDGDDGRSDSSGGFERFGVPVAHRGRRGCRADRVCSMRD